ncbi:hypothetical protein C0992_001397 [Termitomyces sp. T32_za158]|nr:hypothetical protein C0992_001397 [Termitomyces sp. T32_za158]
MSVLDIGINDVSDQERAIKDKLASKDGQITALKTQLSRQNEEMQELRETCNENIRKLMSIKLTCQSSRVVELENELKAQSQIICNEKLAFQNSDQTLTTARATIKQQEHDVRDLESKLACQRSRVVELENELKAQSQIICNEKLAFQNSDQTLTTARATIKQREHDVRDLEMKLDQLSHLSDEHKARADKLAKDKSTLEARVRELQAALPQTVVPPVTPRHRRPARSRSRSPSPSRDRVLALERELDELRSAFRRQEADVMAANEKTIRAQEAQVRLGNEKVAMERRTEKEIAELKAALEEKEDEMRVRTMDAEIFCQREKELEERIDADEVTERDDLQTRLDFLQVESKFELDALNAKVAMASGPAQSSTDDDSRAQTDSLDVLYHASMSEKSLEIRRLGLALTSCGIVIQHLRSEAETLAHCAFDACSSRDEALEKLAKTHAEISELSHRLQQMELNMELNVDFLKDNSREIEELRTELEVKNAELEQTIAAVKSAEEAQEFYKKQYDNAESQRSSLSLEVTNINNELSLVKEELKAAGTRYTELQTHQFEAMSKTDRMRMLQGELMEERARVGRRDEHIKMLQHDIGRMETTLLLQEDRLSEMTTEIDAMTAAKDAMVDDCADAREARDNALVRLEEMEMAMEARVEEGSQTVETLIEVLIQTVGNARERLRMERDSAKEALDLLEEDGVILKMTLEMDAAEQAKQSTIALAVSQVGLNRALNHIRNLEAKNVQLHDEVVTQREDMDRDLHDNATFAQQLDALQTQAATAALDYSDRTTELQLRIENLEQAISANQASHDATIAELVQSKEQLSATLQETQRSLKENKADEEIVILREQYEAQLAQARIQISESERALEEMQVSHATVKDALQKTLEEAKCLREQLDQGVIESLQGAVTRQDAATAKEEEILCLRAEVATALSKQESAEAALEESKIAFERLTTEFNAIKAQHQEILAQSAEEHASIQQDLEGKIADIQARLDEKSYELDNAVQESLEANRKLEEEVASQIADKERHQKELDAVHSQRKHAESALAQMQEEIESTRTELQQSTERIGLLQDEKLSLQGEVTTLEAEVQKSISMRRCLESQIKEMEGKIASQADELEQVRVDLSRADKIANTAEVNLSLQGAQHKREMSELNHQLAALRTQPNLQSALAELEERNDEMEELLRKKCVEIEENDDRALEMLKENKKLTSKVESLTRKVQTLQTKLAAAKASMPASAEAPPNTTLQPSMQPLSASSTLGDRPRLVTSTDTSTPSVSAAPVPPKSAFLSSVPAHAPSCASRAPLHRAVSGPSSLPRPKTPDEESLPNPPVFKAKTPERRTFSSPPAESASSSSNGKKRRAPDDFEVCESLPPQGFTTECVPSTELSEHTVTRRRMLSGLQSGFTPVRNRSRPMTSMPSPKRLMTKKPDDRPSPVITDVTNSPRGQSSKTKRSWLGKIRGASSQSTSSKPVESKPRSEREAS